VDQETEQRLREIYDAYWAGAYRDTELAATLEEVMMHLGAIYYEVETING
jgi:hypothetical protein